MQKKHWITSIMQTCQHPGPFQSHWRTFYYFSKRGWSLLQVFIPNKSLLIMWKSIFREGVVLWLSTPNIVSMDLIVFLFFLILSDWHMTATLPPMLLFSFHHHASCTPTFIHPCAVHGYVFFPSLPFYHCHAVASCFSSISWLCLMHAPNICCHIPSLCWDSLVDPIYTCTDIL